MKFAIAMVFVFSFSSVPSAVHCDKCDTSKIKAVDEHLNNLNYQLVADFFCTLDSSCKNNAEYSEWSNEMLFKVLERSPSLFIKVLTTNPERAGLIFDEIKHPIHDGLDVLKLYDAVSADSGTYPAGLKDSLLSALNIAAIKNGDKR